MSKKLLAEIEALKKRVAELEARPQEAHYHTHYHTNAPYPTIQPSPVWPQFPTYPWIATSGGNGHQQ